jgi:hypothetical protein
MDKTLIHTQAVNLARRYSVQNENDLLQVRFGVLQLESLLDLSEKYIFRSHQFV